MSKHYDKATKNAKSYDSGFFVKFNIQVSATISVPALGCPQTGSIVCTGGE